MLHVYVLVVAVVASIVLVGATLGRIDRARERALRRLGWTLPDSFDWNAARVGARRHGVDVEVHLERRRVVLRAPLEAETTFLRLRSDEGPVPSGLTRTRTEEPAFDERCELFTADGAPPSWLTPELRRALLQMGRRVRVTTDERGARVEVARESIDPAVLERLVRIVAAMSHPAGAQGLDDPLASGRELAPLALRVELGLLPIALVALYFALRPTEVASLSLGPPGQARELIVDVRAGEVFDVWQDVRFDADRYPRPPLWLELEVSGAAQAQLRCSPYMVNACSVQSSSGSVLREGRDCCLEECEPLRAERDGPMRLRARLAGDEPARPYASAHVLRLKRRSRLLAF